MSQLILIPKGLILREVPEMTATIADTSMLPLIYQLKKQEPKIVRHDTAQKEKYENPAYRKAAVLLFLKTQIRGSELLRKKRRPHSELSVLTHPDSTLKKDYKKLAIELMALLIDLGIAV